MKPNRTILTVSLALFMGIGLAWAGCGKKVQMETIDASAEGDRVIVEGTISLRGSMPNPMIILEMEDGVEVWVEGKKEVRRELQSLSGFRVSIKGKMKRIKDDLPRVDAERYELLRLPSGEMPVVGMLGVEGEALVLTAGDGKRYWVRGDLVGAIREYDGAKIWVVGSLGDASLPERPPNSVSYWVTGYGVLEEQR